MSATTQTPAERAFDAVLAADHAWRAAPEPVSVPLRRAYVTALRAWVRAGGGIRSATTEWADFMEAHTDRLEASMSQRTPDRLFGPAASYGPEYQRFARAMGL